MINYKQMNKLKSKYNSTEDMTTSSSPNGQDERKQLQQSGCDGQTECGCQGRLHGHKGIQEAGNGQGEKKRHKTAKHRAASRRLDWQTSAPAPDSPPAGNAEMIILNSTH